MRIALVALDATWAHTNLAVRCLREPLEREGHRVQLLECTINDRTSHILSRLYEAEAEVYGFSCYIWNLPLVLTLGENLKKLRPTARIVLGGPEVSYATERFDGMDWIDTIVCGEGEEVFPSLCRKMAEGSDVPRILRAPNAVTMPREGILYRDGEATGGMLYYESSRGCPYSCAYCLSSATHGVRMKSVEETLADLLRFETLAGDFRIVKLVDRTFNADVRRANAIWKALLDDRFTKTYQFEICASLLDEESYAILARFPKGKIQLEIGLQSTSPETLSAVARHLRPTDILDAVRRLRAPGNLHLHLDLIAGLPFENYDRFAQSFDEAYGIADQLQLGFLKLLYGTPLRERMEEYGYLCQSEPPYTVLASRWLSYPEMQRLVRIEETLSRVVESGRFSHTLWYLDARMPSPFRFWEGLTDFLLAEDCRPIQKRSQPEIFGALLTYGSRLPGVEEVRLKEMLAADFSAGENKKPPRFLR